MDEEIRKPTSASESFRGSVSLVFRFPCRSDACPGATRSGAVPQQEDRPAYLIHDIHKSP
ncbi:hypothetical protein RC55_14390 [Herbaspirillum seropedicae]|nr:hypothetical protein [Herbaspirillum seropedicae]